MLGVDTPNDADPTGDSYAFEKGAEKTQGGDGFADVWKRGRFGWEYKGKHKNLDSAYNQLLNYREALENPPLLVVCDIERFEVHTNFQNTKKEVHKFTLLDLRDEPDRILPILRAVMDDPELLHPHTTREEITEEAARQFAELARSLRERGHEPEAVAHFLSKLTFCFFAEDAGLLPRDLLTDLIDNTRAAPDQFATSLRNLFGLMSEEGGMFGIQRIDWFNGGLFDGDDVLPFSKEDLAIVAETAKLDWAEIEPTILGTLFERGLDPAKRSQLGAHYTDKQSILRVVEPVIMTPLQREFAALQERVAKRLKRLKKQPGRGVTHAG